MMQVYLVMMQGVPSNDASLPSNDASVPSNDASVPGYDVGDELVC